MLDLSPEKMREVFAAIRAAKREGFARGAGPGMDWYDLAKPAEAVVPVATPLANALSRRAGVGVDVVHWKAVTSFRRGDVAPRASVVSYTVATAETPFVIVCAGTSPAMVDLAGVDEVWRVVVPREGLARDAIARHFVPRGDAVAHGLAHLLYHVKAQEERYLVAEIIRQAEAASASALGGVGAQVARVEDPGRVRDAWDHLLREAYRVGGADPDFVVAHPLTMRRHFDAAHTLVNPATGRGIPVMASLLHPEDAVLAVSLHFPYPVPGMSSAIEVEMNSGYAGVEYAPAGEGGEAAGEGDVASSELLAMVDEAVKVYYPGGVCVLRGIPTEEDR